MTKVDDWFAGLPPEQRSLLEELRALILGASDGIAEELKWGQPCYSRKKLFCYLQKAMGHVTLGFQKGAVMPDAPGLLAGAGKEMRMVKFPLGAELPLAGIRQLIAEALEQDQQA